jgi:hypothetical protein
VGKSIPCIVVVSFYEDGWREMAYFWKLIHETHFGRVSMFTTQRSKIDKLFRAFFPVPFFWKNDVNLGRL